MWLWILCLLVEATWAAVPAVNRVVGGVEATPHMAPYVVSMQWENSNADGSSRHFCGGVIISHEWILTAAHCITGTPKDGDMMVVAGKHNLHEREAGEQMRKVNRKVTHQQFTGGIGPYDLAMLHLEHPLEFSSTVAAVNLPQPDTVFTGEAAIFGWGSTSNNLTPNFPATLQWATLPIVDWHECEAVLGGPGATPLHPTNICTGPLDGGHSACHGDSGSALIHINPTTNVHTLLGIVSWGFYPCGAIGSPSIYADVTHFIDWIHKVEGIN
ncbi:lectizyme-like [Lutzomyia longipalpis]|uniref:lectizyme-like n=1 Tax=Lutzomyia longipalpis TaxID=7200 RepID=UPI0024833F73|nr:lectizyme-like [Lutzomyia longipalpis]